ncbi:MAG: Abi family protein [Thiomicrorhabdus sp.]|nr:Abi family protein [Thiomicrorhabdus sp.]
MLFPDTPKHITLLSSIGYYRLSAYWYPFRQRQNGHVLSEFEPGTQFTKITTLYEFDRSLRLLIMDAIERIEITVRSRIIHDLTLKHDVFAHADKTNFHSEFNHKQWFGQVQKEVERSRDEFITHFKQKYEGYPIVPLWCTTEIMSLGNLSRMYKGLLNEDKKSIAHYFNIHPKRLRDWLHVITYVRNVCAHHSRLWNRSLSIRPENVKDPLWLSPITPRNDRIFYILLILRFLMHASENGVDWKQQVEALIEQLSGDKEALKVMGIPNNWKNHPLWT